jgi:ATP-binding cassette subfamily F protein 3
MGVAEVERRIHAMKEPSNRPPQLSIQLKTVHRSGELVIRTSDLVIGYEDDGKPLFRAPDLLLKLGECAAVIGPNGAGKTTFLKTLLGQVPPLEGEVLLGASLKIGYFAQAHEDLDVNKTLVEEVEAKAPGMLLAEIRNYLARFLFSGEDVFRKVGTLSGGERGRLALAVLALSEANLLLLDEPTNHLDIPSQEILQEVLSVYQGTMLLVSHDRYLIDALGTQIWEIQPNQVELQVFNGTYSQLHAYLEQKAQKDRETQPSAKEKRSSSRKQAGSTSKLNQKQRMRLEEIEKQITALEKELADITQKLEDPPDNHAEVQILGESYLQIQSEMDDLLEEWESLTPKD